MAENLLSVLNEHSDEIEKISEDTPINLPVLGETTLGSLIQFLPMYISLTRRKSIRDIIPPDIHSAIMAFAETVGVYEPPPKPQTLKDLDIPAREVAGMAHYLQKGGWSPVQISKQLDLPKITVVRLMQDYDDKSYIMKKVDKLKSWLQRKGERLLERKLDQFLAIEDRLKKEEEVEKNP